MPVALSHIFQSYFFKKQWAADIFFINLFSSSKIPKSERVRRRSAYLNFMDFELIILTPSSFSKYWETIFQNEGSIIYILK